MDLTGSAAAAMQHPINQGNKEFHKCNPILVAKWLPLARRVELLFKAVWASVLWCSATWNATKVQRTSLDSWGARLVTTMAGNKALPGGANKLFGGGGYTERGTNEWLALAHGYRWDAF